MNDIELTRATDNTYDWRLDGIDVCTVNGDNGLRNSIIHILQLRPYELEQYPYIGKGAQVYDLLGAKPSGQMKAMIQETISNSINELVEVNSCEVEVEQEEGHYTITRILVRTTDGREVEIHGI